MRISERRKRSVIQARLLKKLAREFPRLGTLAEGSEREVDYENGIFTYPTGFWRTSSHISNSAGGTKWDLYVSWVDDERDRDRITHKRFHLGSYYTMTECVKKTAKLKIEKLRFNQFEIYIQGAK